MELTIFQQETRQGESVGKISSLMFHTPDLKRALISQSLPNILISLSEKILITNKYEILIPSGPGDSDEIKMSIPAIIHERFMNNILRDLELQVKLDKIGSKKRKSSFKAIETAHVTVGFTYSTFTFKKMYGLISSIMYWTNLRELSMYMYFKLEFDPYNALSQAISCLIQLKVLNFRDLCRYSNLGENHVTFVRNINSMKDLQALDMTGYTFEIKRRKNTVGIISKNVFRFNFEIFMKIILAFRNIEILNIISLAQISLKEYTTTLWNSLCKLPRLYSLHLDFSLSPLAEDVGLTFNDNLITTIKHLREFLCTFSYVAVPFEEIFEGIKQSQLESLTLKVNYIIKYTAFIENLVQILKNQINLKKFDISCIAKNDISEYELDELASAAKNHSSIEDFSLRMSKAKSKQFENFDAMINLRMNSVKLKKFLWSDGHNTIKWNNEKENSDLELFLFTQEKYLDDFDVFEKICEKLYFIKKVKIELWFVPPENGLRNKFASSFLSLTELKELYIDIGLCRAISESDSLQLISFKPLKNLELLHFNYSSYKNITDQFIIAFSYSLAYLFNLKILDLNFKDCTSITSKGLLALVNSVRNLRNLHELKLDFELIKIEDSLLLEIAKFLVYMKKMKVLELKFGMAETIISQLTRKSISKLIGTFQYMTCIEMLKFNFDSILEFNDDMLCEFSIGIMNLCKLKCLELSLIGVKKLGSSGLFALINSLKLLKFLESLELSFGRAEYFTDQGIKNLLNFCRETPRLKVIKLVFTNCKLNFRYLAMIQGLDKLFNKEKLIGNLHVLLIRSSEYKEDKLNLD